MNRNCGWVSVWLRGVAVAVSLLAISGCSRTVSWTEEVQLSNGQVIVVERETEHSPGGPELAIGTGWRPKQYRIRIEYPPQSGQTIEWRSEKLSPAKYPEFPLYLDYDEGVGGLFVVSIKSISDSCDVYLKYVTRDLHWVEETLPAEFESFATNLYIPAAGLDIPRKVTLKIKWGDNSDFRYRKRLKQIGPKQKVCGA